MFRYMCLADRIKKELRSRNMLGEKIQKGFLKKEPVLDEKLEGVKISKDPEDVRYQHVFRVFKRLKEERIRSKNSPE